MDKAIIRLGKRTGAKINLYCFPYAGVGASAYAGWAELVPEWIELFCFQPPGREQRFRERSLTTMSDVMAAVVPALAATIDRPYVFYGHSMGALVAYEGACKLRALGYPEPEYLFVGASRAPQLPWPHRPIRHLPDLEFLDEVNLRYGSVPAQVRDEAELRAIFVPALRGDFSIVETYQCAEARQLTCPISAFAGEQDQMVTKESVEVWGQRTTGRFQARDVRGSHLFLRTAPKQIHEAILQDLETALSDAAGIRAPNVSSGGPQRT